MSEMFIGRTVQGERVYVNIRLEEQTGEHTTTEHATIAGPVARLSVAGSVYSPGKITTKADRYLISMGQCDDAPARVVNFRETNWTRADVLSLAKIWQQWHLNDMRAGCAHMTLPEDPSYDARRDIVCPVTGYKYGHAWLVDILPADVVAEVRRLQAIA